MQCSWCPDIDRLSDDILTKPDELVGKVFKSGPNLEKLNTSLSQKKTKKQI